MFRWREIWCWEECGGEGGGVVQNCGVHTLECFLVHPRLGNRQRTHACHTMGTTEIGCNLSLSPEHITWTENSYGGKACLLEIPTYCNIKPKLYNVQNSYILMVVVHWRGSLCYSSWNSSWWRMDNSLVQELGFVQLVCDWHLGLPVSFSRVESVIASTFIMVSCF